MTKSFGHLLIVLFLTILVIVGQSVHAVAEEVKEPSSHFPEEPISVMGKGSNGNEETPGEWYAGETPSDLKHDAPVLLFVPGLNNAAQIFWEDNDMPQLAYDAGYQTAFVQLYDAGGASADMWDNGELLADKIEEISSYFDGKKVTIIGYSKGGIDAQTALTYYDASEHVDNVITLSSPHHGSQLADLANSSWAGWLADLIGMQGEGTTAMETGYMESFRSMIDQEPLAYANDYFTLGGTDWGSMFSSTWFGACIYPVTVITMEWSLRSVAIFPVVTN
ncbi:alpha/beta fold hydrolase [Virgibacillus sp. NKC19-3]|uniref:esterase/lipase family protein n=1 Tax=Virgibacillus saliphilus TaxID=2831674 RepID=UPI001C9A87CB|nr:alpha/beta fold hydrolase [Virgibacillus sp. NKC19-3]MBY7144355.1 alpha/beta fold hydrolase [Virgibacillus sp. NKC19-3]